LTATTGRNVKKGGETPATAFVPYGIADVNPEPDFRTVGGDYISVKPEDYEKNVAEAKRLLLRQVTRTEKDSRKLLLV